MYIINIMWLIGPVALFTILFILLISKSLIKSKKVFFAFFVLILVYAILSVACYYFYEIFLSNQYISLLISLSCIALGGFINLIVVYLGIAKLKKIDSKEELLILQHDIEKNMRVEDKWFNMLFSYTADRWIVSDINEDLFSKLDEGNFEEDGAEIIEMNKEIKIINENYKFLKRNLRRKFFFLKNLKSITNLEDSDEIKKLVLKKNKEFSPLKETDNTIEIIKKLSNELLNLVRVEENDKTKNIEENLARTINYMSGVLYNQLRSEKLKIKEAKLNEFSTYIQAEKILLDNIDELRENMYTYTYKIKRKLREFKNSCIK
ncbi:MFS transporter [Fusobacterium polymorphum]|nr:MFS transporter [Fusobacterium polymorphum]